MSNGASHTPHEPRETTFRSQREPSTRELIGQVAGDSRNLIREEIQLAKLELKENLGTLKRHGFTLAAGIALLAVGGLTLMAFLVLALGLLLGGSYWLSALIIGIVFAALGAFLTRRGTKGLSTDELTPERTLRSLEEDRRWLKEEAQDFRDDLSA